MNFISNAWKGLIFFALVILLTCILVSERKYKKFMSLLLGDHGVKLQTSLSTNSAVTLLGSQDGKIFEGGLSVNLSWKNTTDLKDSSMIHLTYPRQRSSNNIIILYWLKGREKKVPRLGLKRKCMISGEKTCSFTQDPTLYNWTEAIIFNLFYAEDFPSHRYSDQKWVLFGGEAPPQCMEVWPKSNILDRIRHQFNISSMYTLDSAVPLSLPYKCIFNKDAHKTSAVPGINVAENRMHNVVWLVSHCKTQSQREDYVEALRQHIDVDVYGECGNMSCGSKHQRMPPCAEEILNHKYRFYLSFENSLCQDYVTEKLKKILKPGIKIIPVVMGAVNYSAILPQKTYIDVKDFQSPRHLAAYLHMVANNQTLFNEYIRRKSVLTCKRHSEPYLCRLCKYLHTHRGKVETISDVVSYWNVQDRCIKPQSYLPGNFWTLY